MAIGDERTYLAGWMVVLDHWRRFMRAGLRVVDKAHDDIVSARLAAMPGQVQVGTGFGGFDTIDALATIGRDRGILRGKREAPDLIAARLRDWHAARRSAGTSPGLLFALRSVLAPLPARVRLVKGGPASTDGAWWTLDDDGLRYQDSESRGMFWPADGGPPEPDSLAAAGWDWDSRDWPGSENPDPSRTWAIVYAPAGGPDLASIEGTFDDGLSQYGDAEAGTGDKLTIGTTATAGYVEAARATVAAFKPAGVIVPHIIVTFDLDAFHPDPGVTSASPDGNWKHHGKIVPDGSGGYDRVRARYDGARYWIGTV